MQIPKLQTNNINTSFSAGNVKLYGMNPNEFHYYDTVKKIAEMDKLDFSITKCNESMVIKDSNFYAVIAKKEINKHPFIAGGTHGEYIRKHIPNDEISAKLYNAVIESVKKLANNIQKLTGNKPEFLKYLKK